MTTKIKGLLISALLPLSFASIADETTNKVTVAKPETGCGIVSIFKKPPQTKSIYRVVIDKVNDQTIPETAQFQLPVGKYKFKVIELIQDSRFTRRRGEMKNFKDFEVVVEANTKYEIGAKYIRKNRSKLKTGEYWEPVIWKKSSVTCSA